MEPPVAPQGEAPPSNAPSAPSNAAPTKKERKEKKMKKREHKHTVDVDRASAARGRSVSPTSASSSSASSASPPAPASRDAVSQPPTPLSSSPVPLRATHSTPALSGPDPPLLIFVNPKSGAQQGSQLLPMMAKVIGSTRAVDIMKAKGPHEAIKQFGIEPNIRIVACGGDGTIRWVIAGVIEAKLPNLPIMGVLPLGTGNDLSREFGWGMGYAPKESEISDIVKNLKIAKARPLDIWQVKLTPWDPATKVMNAEKTRTEIMFNYFNMGFDSQAALGFHNLRNESPELFKARFMNKAFYGLYALESWVSGTPILSECLEVMLDGKPVTLPEDLRTLVFLNFTCYQGGMDVWGPLKEKDSMKPRMDDGKLEVVGLGGLWHEMKARTEVSHGHRIGQAATAEVRVVKPVAIAMAHDGEPFSREPCVISISHWGTVPILVHPEHEAKEEKKRLKAEKKRLKAATKTKSAGSSPTTSPRSSRP